MSMDAPNSFELSFRPVTTQNWHDFEKLFGKNGACGGCWCMFMRMQRSEFQKQKGEGTKLAMKNLVDSGETPGILAYCDQEPIGWCSVAPRENFSALERSRIAKPLDHKPVWSVVCFFVHKDFRKQNVSVALLRAAIDYVKAQGGKIVEGYPVEPKKSPMPPPFVWSGLASAFLKAGFVECARRSETRPFMRYEIH